MEQSTTQYHINAGYFSIELILISIQKYASRKPIHTRVETSTKIHPWMTLDEGGR